MQPIPVFGLVRAAYGFAFGRFWAVLGVSWIWLTLSVWASTAYGPRINAALRDFEARQDIAALAPVTTALIVVFLLQLISFAAITVALMRIVILSEERKLVLFHVWTGAPEFRLLGAFLLIFAGGVAALIAAEAVLSVVMALAESSGANPQGVAGMAAGVLYAALIWAGIRLSLTSPVASVEAAPALKRSWQLTLGNSLRLFFAALFTFLPFVFAVSLIVMTIVIPIVGPVPAPVPNDAAATEAAMRDWMGKVQQLQFSYPLATAIFSALVSMLGFGLNAGLFGSAYKAIAGSPEG